MTDYLLAEEAGKAPTPAQVLTTHPEVQQELTTYFELRGTVPRLGASPSDPGPLADAVSGLLSDASAAQRMAAEAKQMVRQRYAWPSIAASTAAAYRATIADAPENRAQARARLAAGRPAIVVPDGNLLSLDTS